MNKQLCNSLSCTLYLESKTVLSVNI